MLGNVEIVLQLVEVSYFWLKEEEEQKQQQQQQITTTNNNNKQQRQTTTTKQQQQTTTTMVSGHDWKPLMPMILSTWMTLSGS